MTLDGGMFERGGARGKRFPATVLLAAAALLPAATSRAQNAAPVPLSLAPSGPARLLPERLLGASAEPFYERLIGNQAKQEVLAALHPAYVRFPGGTQSNYYDWKSGLIFVTGYPNSSAYTNFWVGLSQRVDATFPNGIFLEQFKPFADTIGADVVLVPNLETAAVADQVAWFSRLASEGIVPTHIELGNEFWIAMGGDPNVEAKWPDEPTSMAIMRRYLDALRPYLPPGTRAAVQAAPGAFMFLRATRARSTAACGSGTTTSHRRAGSTLSRRTSTRASTR